MSEEEVRSGDRNEVSVQCNAKRSSEGEESNAITNPCDSTQLHTAHFTLHTQTSPIASQLNLTPHCSLEQAFPRPGRAFSWNRMRKQLLKEGYEVPKLRQNPVIDRLVWFGFSPFMYSCITVFLFGLLLFVGIHQPVGIVTPYIECICIGIIVLYVLFLILVTGIEALFGLYDFPEGLETTDDLLEAIKKTGEEDEQ